MVHDFVIVPFFAIISTLCFDEFFPELQFFLSNQVCSLSAFWRVLNFNFSCQIRFVYFQRFDDFFPSTSLFLVNSSLFFFSVFKKRVFFSISFFSSNVLVKPKVCFYFQFFDEFFPQFQIFPSNTKVCLFWPSVFWRVFSNPFRFRVFSNFSRQKAEKIKTKGSWFHNKSIWRVIFPRKFAV